MYIAHGCDRSVGIQCERGSKFEHTSYNFSHWSHVNILEVDSEMGYTLIKTHETFNHDTE